MHKHQANNYVFTARRYASAVLAIVVCPSVRSSLAGIVSKRLYRITQATPHDSPGTLVFCRQRSPRNSNGVTLNRGDKYKWGSLKSATLTNITRKQYKIDA